MINRRLLLTAALLALTAAPAAAADQTEGAKAFIQSLGAETIATFSDKSLTKELAREKFAGLLRKGFDVPYIGRWVLGRFWAQAAPAQQTEYLALFEKLIVETYASRFAGYSGETFKVTGARAEDPDMVVVTQISRPSGPPVDVEWRVRSHGSDNRIIDVAVSGVSMGITQRSEFASVVSNGGIDGLLRALRSRPSGG